MNTSLSHVSLIGNELALAFSDGAELYLPLPMLRRACPCAVCQGEPDALGRVVKPEVEYASNSFDLVKWETVGGYALQLHWADGHGFGIYTYPYLTRLASFAE